MTSRGSPKISVSTLVEIEADVKCHKLNAMNLCNYRSIPRRLPHVESSSNKTGRSTFSAALQCGISRYTGTPLLTSLAQSVSEYSLGHI